MNSKKRGYRSNIEVVLEPIRSRPALHITHKDCQGQCQRKSIPVSEFIKEGDSECSTCKANTAKAKYAQKVRDREMYGM